jgi:hypothetical protein
MSSASRVQKQKHHQGLKKKVHVDVENILQKNMGRQKKNTGKWRCFGCHVCKVAASF